MNFKEEIELLIYKNIATYNNDYNRFLADYNDELKLIKDYNGRQLLELLQNADDAKSPEVKIEMNKYKRKLIISNKGEAFSIGGIKSLMISNLSTKTKTTYIGNKGLGFRSILNWAESVSIYSNGCKIDFSEEIATKAYRDLKYTQKEFDSIKKERNLTEETVPFAILSVPRVSEFSDIDRAEWTTSIEIKYKQEYENDIEEQLLQIREEILLFLNHIDMISIYVDEENAEDHVFERIKKKNEVFEEIQIRDKKWRVFTKEGVLPNKYQDETKNEKQSYNVKVAFSDGLTDQDCKLYNYFPTQVSIKVPCILHGTFELNNSRNHLNDLPINKYILKQMEELMEECSTYLAKDRIDWQAYLLLSPSSYNSDSNLISDFYSGLEILKNKLKIFPCINDEYMFLDQIKYYTDEFSEFSSMNFAGEFKELLQPLDEKINSTSFSDRRYDEDELINKIDSISIDGLSIEKRADLICLLSSNEFALNGEKRFSLLVDDNLKVIYEEEVAFTPVVKSEGDFNVPEKVKIAFMNSDLYSLLEERLKNQFNPKEKSKPRELQRIVKRVVNLQPYDSNNVIDKIISSVNSTLNTLDSIEEKKSLIKDMVNALYSNFKIIENRQEKLKVNISLISKDIQIVKSKDLFLSKSYTQGEIVDLIYGDSLLNGEYLVALSYWGIEDVDLNLVDEFFKWLGVNAYSMKEIIDLKNAYPEQDYLDFIFRNGLEKIDDFNMGRITKDTTVTKIKNLSQISKISKTKIILLIAMDSDVYNNISINSEFINWSYNYKRQIKSEYSYIRYQFIKLGLFSNYVIEELGENIQKLVNEDFDIDYGYLENQGVDKTTVRSILRKLGAKESFVDLPSRRIYKIINSVWEKDKEQTGRGTQTIYKMCLDALVKQKSLKKEKDKLVFFAKEGNCEKYLPSNEIFYSDNTLLPKRVLDGIPILNLAKRTGEDNVEKYFGIKSLRDFTLSIDYKNLVVNDCNISFSELFEAIKPYLLIYRLSKLKADNSKRQDEANILKKCTIQIVSKCYYDFGDDTNQKLGEGEFINQGNKFYFSTSRIVNLKDLLKDSIFCDAFAEMMCIIFKANDKKNDFRQVLKNDIGDTKHVVNVDFEKELIDEVYKYLGLAKEEIEFWKRVFCAKGLTFDESIHNEKILNHNIKKELGYNLANTYKNVDFIDFNNVESYLLIKDLVSYLRVEMNSIIPNGLHKWYAELFLNSIKNFECEFRNVLWHNLNADKEEQKNYISILNKYNSSFIDDFANDIEANKYILDVDFDSIVKLKIAEIFNVNIEIVLDRVYEINLYESLFEGNGFDYIEDLSIKSLFYFSGNDVIIDDYIKRQLCFNESEKEVVGEIDSSQVSLSYASLSASNVNLQSNDSISHHSSIHTSKVDESKKKKGKIAEMIAYEKLINDFGVDNVKWVSGNSTTPDKSDKLHYDIEYKNAREEWKYLEVKAMSGRNIIISRHEVEYGGKFPYKFELALVVSKDVFIIENPFVFLPGESVENNSKFTAVTKDYEFYFDICRKEK